VTFEPQYIGTIPTGPRNRAQIKTKRNTLETSSSGAFERVMDWLVFAGDYTRREMSFESDALLAFWSVMEMLYRSTKSGFVSGLCETYRDVALMWQPRSRLRRRKSPCRSGHSFPTWPWTGWVRLVYYEDGDLSRESPGRLEYDWFLLGFDDKLWYLDIHTEKDVDVTIEQPSGQTKICWTVSRNNLG
jgi:hypothetical protein